VSARYVALLRAINVGGHVVKMDVLRKHFTKLGFTNVETFIASGNVLFDADQQILLVAVTPPDALALVDPTAGSVTRRIPLSGCRGAHGLAEDRSHRLAFVACEDNARLAVVDLRQGRQQAILAVGGGPDVLAYDAGLGRLYVASESGVVSVFDTTGPVVRKLGQAHLAAHAHSVSIDPRTHQVFFPLERLQGHPVLRVLRP